MRAVVMRAIIFYIVFRNLTGDLKETGSKSGQKNCLKEKCKPFWGRNLMN